MSTARSLLPIPSVDRRQVAGVTTVDHSRVAAALEAATSKNTRRVYYSGWERWHRWAADRGAQLMPADPAAVAAYLAERAEQVSPAAVTARPRQHRRRPPGLRRSRSVRP